MSRVFFAWVFFFVFLLLTLRFSEWVMKKSWVFKSLIYGYDVRTMK
ncbi:hypothetical protein ES703_52912 [subsurface metagenome]